jgi:UrcA family protein
MKSRSTTLVLSILLAAAPFAMAHADEVPRQVVKFSDLDLQADAGVHKLFARIETAARAVCEAYDTHTIGSMSVVNRCRARAVTGAIAELNMPALTRYHAEQSGQPMLVVRR